MKIAAIRCDRMRFPLDPPFHAAWDPVPRRHFDATLVRVTTDEGVVGVGSGGTIEPLPGGDWAGLRSLRGRLRCAAAPVRRAWPPVRRAWPRRAPGRSVSIAQLSPLEHVNSRVRARAAPANPAPNREIS